MRARLAFLHDCTRPGGGEIADHLHGCQELVYYLSGKGMTGIDGRAYPYAGGDFSLIRPSTTHSEVQSCDTQVFFIGFQVEDWEIALPNGLFHDAGSIPLLQRLHAMKREMLDRKPLHEQMMEALLQELLVDVVRLVANEPTPPKSLVHVERYLLENYAQPMDYLALAEMAGYSYHRFRHLFKERYGASPHQHVFRLRMNQACRLLTATDMPITGVAHNVGFVNDSQFCSLFRRTYGCTPGDYRRKSPVRGAMPLSGSP